MPARAAAAADASVNAGFGGYYHTSAFDNFSVVPEPGVLPLLSLGGLLLTWLRVRAKITSDFGGSATGPCARREERGIPAAGSKRRATTRKAANLEKQDECQPPH